jgi:hypothetical protein
LCAVESGIAQEEERVRKKVEDKKTLVTEIVPKWEGKGAFTHPSTSLRAGFGTEDTEEEKDMFQILGHVKRWAFFYRSAERDWISVWFEDSAFRSWKVKRPRQATEACLGHPATKDWGEDYVAQAADDYHRSRSSP